jgi:hypothetical protein
MRLIHLPIMRWQLRCIDVDYSAAQPLGFLKKPLTWCSVLTRCEMLQHGYNGSELAPFQYEASALSTTIALRGVTVLSHHLASTDALYQRAIRAT